MRLAFHELLANSGEGSLSQKLLNTSEDPLLIYAVRPCLIKWGAITGNLYCEITNAAGTVIATSETIAISTITSANYAWGYVRFLVNAIVAAESYFYVLLKASSYTPALDSAFVGWCTDYATRKYDLETTLLADPLDVEIWDWKQRLKGGYP